MTSYLTSRCFVFWVWWWVSDDISLWTPVFIVGFYSSTIRSSECVTSWQLFNQWNYKTCSNGKIKGGKIFYVWNCKFSTAVFCKYFFNVWNQGIFFSGESLDFFETWKNLEKYIFFFLLYSVIMGELLFFLIHKIKWFLKQSKSDKRKILELFFFFFYIFFICKNSFLQIFL